MTNSSREVRGMASSIDPVASVSDITPGTARKVEVAGEGVLVCNVDGTFYAIEDLCSHDGGELDADELEGCRIMCPRHGAFFDVTTGAALTLPAIVPIRTYSVRVEGESIFVDT